LDFRVFLIQRCNGYRRIGNYFDERPFLPYERSYLHFGRLHASGEEGWLLDTGSWLLVVCGREPVSSNR
jgi:hypothetical protein